MGNKLVNTALAEISIKVLVVAFGLILVLLPFHAFLSTWGGTTIGPLLLWKSWKEILLIILALPLLIYLAQNVSVAQKIWERGINKVVFAYVIITLIWSLFSTANITAIAAGLAFNLRFFAIFLLAQILVLSAHRWVEILKNFAGPVLLGVTIVISVLAVAQVTVLPSDFLSHFGYNEDSTIAPVITVDENPDAPRAFATLRGPNTLGAFLILPIALAVAFLFAKKHRISSYLTLGLGSLALLLTGARSAWIGAAVSILALFILELPKDRLLKAIKWGAVPVILVSSLLIWLAVTVPALRLAIFHSSPGDPSLFEGSTQEHWEATLRGIKEVVASPVGGGVGSAGPASFYSDEPNLAENYYVQIAQETSVIGLGIFIVICILVARRLWFERKSVWPKALLASFLGLAVINLFLHGWADDPTSMIWWAMAGLFAWPGRTKQ